MDVTVVFMDVLLKSDGREIVNDLNSASSTFKYQLHKIFRSAFDPADYKGLYSGTIPGPVTQPAIAETSVSYMPN